jgi:phage-related tail protein
VLTGLRTFYFVAGKLRTARELAGQMIEIAARNPDKITTYLANVGVGVSAAWMGELRSAREYLEQALSVDENTISAIGASGSPPMSAVISPLSYVLWMLGYPAQALREVALMTSLLSRPVNFFEHAATIQSLLWNEMSFPA